MIARVILLSRKGFPIEKNYKTAVLIFRVKRLQWVRLLGKFLIP